MKKGQIALPIAMVGSIVMSVIVGATSYFSSINAQESKVAEVKQTAAVLEARVGSVENNIKEIKDDIKSNREEVRNLTTKIDKLLWANGIKSSPQ